MSIDQMMAELRKEYVSSLPEKLDSILRHWEQRNVEDLRNDFHKLKGTGSTYGLPEVTNLGLMMEKLCKNAPDKLEAAMPLVEKAITRIYELRSQDKDLPPTGIEELMQLQKFESA